MAETPDNRRYAFERNLRHETAPFRQTFVPFGGVAGMYAAVEDCVRDERNRQQALQDEMEGTLEARYGMDPAQFSGVKVAPPELTEI